MLILFLFVILIFIMVEAFYGKCNVPSAISLLHAYGQFMRVMAVMDGMGTRIVPGLFVVPVGCVYPTPTST